MKIHFSQLQVKTSGGTDLVDLTEQVDGALSESGVSNGMANVFVAGSTASISTIEYESGALSDLKQAIDRMAPRDIPYRHDQRWGDGNGYSHVRAAMMKPGITVPIQNGRLLLGTWQQIILMDFDNRPRSRKVIVQVMGE